ncbi:TPA: site-specific DNA-methyltransferase [Streptococcus agalactiae]|nr:site-specific DNA-methyltransferase [Streptococcus agalactiae]
MKNKIKSNYIINLDALVALKELPNEIFDCCITSPPYYGLRDYKVKGQIGREESPEEYLNKLVEVFDQVKRVLKKDGTLWIVIGDSYVGTGSKKEYKDQKNKNGRTGQKVSVTKKLKRYKTKDLIGIPWQLALKLREDGWYLRSDIIWHKENAMPESCKDRPSRSYEHIFLLSKSKKYFYNYEAMKEPMKEISKKRYIRARGKDNKYLKENTGAKRQSINEAREYGEYIGDNVPQFRNSRDIWTINTNAFKGKHYAVFPPKLVEICIKAACPNNGLILDPFMGSGTVGMVATKMNREYIGIELNEDYCKMAKERIEENMK